MTRILSPFWSIAVGFAVPMTVGLVLVAFPAYREAKVDLISALGCE